MVPFRSQHQRLPGVLAAAALAAGLGAGAAGCRPSDSAIERRAGKSEPAPAATAADATAPATTLDFAVGDGDGGWCSSEIIDLRPPLTVEAWVRPAPASATGGAWTAIELGGGSPEEAIGLVIDGAALAPIRDGARLTEAVALPVDLWSHLALVVEGDGRAALRIWNARDGEGERAWGAARSSPPLLERICFARRAAGGGEAGGMIDEARLWEGTLSADTVRAWRHRGVDAAHPDWARLAAAWPFSEGAGGRAADLRGRHELSATAPSWHALPRLDYGPILRTVSPDAAHFLFHASPDSASPDSASPDSASPGSDDSDADAAAIPWAGAVELATDPAFGAAAARISAVVVAGAATDHVAHVVVSGLQPQTTYHYAPLIDGRRARDGGGSGAAFPAFTTPPRLDGRSADFAVAYFADQHVASGPRPTPIPAFAAAAAQQPLFWVQLGDVAGGGLTPAAGAESSGGDDEDAEAGGEAGRTPALLAALWKRNFGGWDSPQAAFARTVPLGAATINDHEIVNNFSLNWHGAAFAAAADPAAATLHDRAAQYNRGYGAWWNWFGWGAERASPLGAAAAADFGGGVMAEGEAPVRVAAGLLCPAGAGELRFEPGDFVYLLANAADPLYSRVAALDGDCGDGRPGVRLANALPSVVPTGASTGGNAGSGWILGKGARYALAGHYGALRPYPFVELFTLDTTSYRGDPYQTRAHAEDANRDRDHTRYRHTPGPPDALHIHGDRDHGANRTTDGVRSWLGPVQKAAFLRALAASPAAVVVVQAGYPLVSAKFEDSRRYWEARESGFDFAGELDEILAALERADKLVVWVHGDGHSPAIVRLRPNVYQLQVGPTYLAQGGPGHHSRSLASGDSSRRASYGGGRVLGLHQPDLDLRDPRNDVFDGPIDSFQGFLRLRFHPGYEVLRRANTPAIERIGDRIVAFRAPADPAKAGAARQVIGKVARVVVDGRPRWSTVAGYSYGDGRARFELADPVLTAEPTELRILVEANPSVEARWFDDQGREWSDLTVTMRRER